MKKTIIYITTILLIATIIQAAPAYLNNTATINLFKDQGTLTPIGISLQGKTIYALNNNQINPNGTKNLIVIRQHGVEYYASYVAYGMIKQAKYYKGCQIEMIINANPDGIDLKRGENSLKLNLNRLWNETEEKAYETKINRDYLNKQTYTKIIDMHAYGGSETQSEILTADKKSGEYCKKNVFPPYKCKDTSMWASPGTLREYSIKKGTPLSITIETKQNTWKNATRQQLERMGKDLAWFICK